MSIESIISIILGSIGTIGGIVAAILALRKFPYENEKTKAEIVEIYSKELRELKIEFLGFQENSKNKEKEFGNKIKELEIKLNQQINERKEEQLKYREFINELLFGITKLTGQIQMNGKDLPVWSPPEKNPFDC